MHFKSVLQPRTLVLNIFFLYNPFIHRHASRITVATSRYFVRLKLCFELRPSHGYHTLNTETESQPPVVLAIMPPRSPVPLLATAKVIQLL